MLARGTLIASASLMTLAGFARAQCEPQWLPDDGNSGFQSIPYCATVWDPDGAGPAEPVLVAGGLFASIGSVFARHIASWNGARWNAVGPGLSAHVYAVHVHAGELYAAGAFTPTDGISPNHIARWDGSSWQPLGTGLNYLGYAMATFQGQLIVGGSFTTAGGVSALCVAAWDGTAWHAMGNGFDNQVRALCVYNGELYAGGKFQRSGTASVRGFARWNGSAWVIPDGTSSVYQVESLLVFNGQLILGGRFTIVGGHSSTYVIAWDGTAWHAMPGLPYSGGGVVYGLGELDNKLYAATESSVRWWTGTGWNTAGTTGDSVFALAPYQGELHAFGRFVSMNGLPAPRWARWGAPVAPAITDNPDPSATCTGGTLTLSAAATGTWPLSYAWRKDGTPLSDGPTGNGSSITGAHAATLQISDAATADAGSYDCVVTNACSSATSAAAAINVCAADVDCNGYVNGADFDGFVGAFVRGDPAADFDHNSFVNGVDFDSFVALFEAGC